MQRNATQRNATQCNAMQRNATQRNTTQHNTAHTCLIPFWTWIYFVLYCLKKGKTHVGKLETYVWDKESCIGASTCCAKDPINYNDLAKRFNLQNKNGKLQYLWKVLGSEEGGVTKSTDWNSCRSQPCKKWDQSHLIISMDPIVPHNWFILKVFFCKNNHIYTLITH